MYVCVCVCVCVCSNDFTYIADSQVSLRVSQLKCNDLPDLTGRVANAV
jgi:hypothetical protein